MFGIHDFAAFLVAGILLNLTPGQDTMYIIGRAVAHGRRIGIASALGISAGCLIHTLATAVGLSALLAASSTAFLILKWLGAAYLIYLGARLLLAREPAQRNDDTAGKVGFVTAFRQGVLINVSNPKVALFFLAFLPQFIDPGSTTKVAAFLLLGLTFVTTGTIWCLILAWCADAMRKLLAPSMAGSNGLSRICGVLLIALGARLAASNL